MSAVDKAKTVIPNTPIEFDVPSLPAPSGNGLPGWPYMSYTNLHSLNLDWVIAMIKAYGEYMYAVQQALLEWTGETNDLLQQLIDTVNKWGDQISYIIDKLPESTVDELLGILDTVQEHTSEINALIADVSGLKAADTTLGQRIDTLQNSFNTEIAALEAQIESAEQATNQVQSNLQSYVTSNNAALAATNEQVEKNRQDILTLSGGAEGELARIQALEESQTEQDTKITNLQTLTANQGESIAENTTAIGNINTVNEQQSTDIRNLQKMFQFAIFQNANYGSAYLNVNTVTKDASIYFFFNDSVANNFPITLNLIQATADFTVQSANVPMVGRGVSSEYSSQYGEFTLTVLTSPKRLQITHNAGGTITTGMGWAGDVQFFAPSAARAKSSTLPLGTYLTEESQSQ